MTDQAASGAPDAGEAIERQAAEFLQRRRFWNWTDADQVRLDAWLAESLAHRVAFLRLEAGAAQMERLAALRPSGDARGLRFRAVFSRRFVWPVLIAASLAFAFVGRLPLLAHFLEPPDRSFATDVGGRALLRFGDGTEIELNTDSAVRYRMTTKDRIVWLDRGEAWFRVAHDAVHPFTVYVGRDRVTDLGTEFLVRHDAGAAEVEVALLKGRAELDAPNTAGNAAMLAPGDDAIARATSTKITHRTPQELADEMAWRRGVLVFRNTALADVVREFNRYNTTRLVLVDPSIAGVKVSAELKTDHYEDFLQVAQSLLRLRIDREGNEILISRGERTKVKKTRTVGAP